MVQMIKEYLIPVQYLPSFLKYSDDLRRLFRFMTTLATGPNGAHAEFIQ